MRSIFVALLLSLSACVAPQTLSPKASQMEIAQETDFQQHYLEQERLKGLVHGIISGKPIKPRLQEVVGRLAPVAVDLCRDLGKPKPIECAYDIHVLKTKGDGDALNAYADGKTVYISAAMAKFADQDADLAFIIAHEFSHNIMQHQSAQTGNLVMATLLGALADAAVASQGYNTRGEISRTAAESTNLAYSPKFEQEADYIGLYLLARAGYDYHNVPEFWRRMSLENPDAIFVKTTHPTNPERYVVMRKTIAQMDRKRREKMALVPEFKPEM